MGFFNTTDEEVPPYACMQRWKPKHFDPETAAENTATPDRFACSFLRAGQIVWCITKCNAQAESRQDPSEFLFNGPVPVPPLTYGRCVGLPAQVLHNARPLINGRRALDLIDNFGSCGPVKDKWFVLSGRPAFTNVNHDVSSPVGGGPLHTVWVDRGSGKAVSAHMRVGVSGTVAAGEFFAFNENSSSQLLKALSINDDGYLEIERDGLYSISFQGLVTSAGATRGDMLSVALYRLDDDEDEPTATPYEAAWPMQVEAGDDDLELGRGSGWLSLSGFENLRAGDGLRLKNTSTEAISLTRGLFSIIAQGSYYEENPESSDGAWDADD